ncbi:hypothetical protein LIER_23827 [Lithospermum erythrorhizon]|uniref:Gag-pol polyprotein n=1 Tax=Lithospermum erythrorhizon TaxID=34254 RepID=A0AAV3QYX8_LITER
MEGFKEEASISRPPLLDDSNYAYWKAKMTAFLRSIDSKTSKSVKAGWTAPTVTNNNVVTVKPVEEWTREEDEVVLANDKALNAIFNVVDINVFKLINTCTVAKTAWETLETAYEGTQKVRMSRLQQLTTRFETLRMEDDETIVSYNNNIKDITNESFSLGEVMSNEKLVRKVLRTHPNKFAHKVTAIEEAQDLTTMRLDEFMENLTTFEMSLDDGESSNKKGIALKATAEATNDENLVETMNLLAKNCNKILKRFTTQLPMTKGPICGGNL